VSVLTSQSPPAKPDYSPFPPLPSSRPPSSKGTPATSQFQQQSAQTQSATAALSPFTSATQRQSSPFQFLQQHPQSSTPSSSLLDLTQQPKPQVITNADAEEWTFTSSLPVQNNTPPSSNEIIVTNSSVHVLLEVTRPPTNEATIRVLARFSNNALQSISDLTFQVAVTKVLRFPELQSASD
jgi:hypothetical protein